MGRPSVELNASFDVGVSVAVGVSVDVGASLDDGASVVNVVLDVSAVDESKWQFKQLPCRSRQSSSAI